MILHGIAKTIMMFTQQITIFTAVISIEFQWKLWKQKEFFTQLENLKKKLNFHGHGPKTKEIPTFKLFGNSKKNLEFQKTNQHPLMLLILNQQSMMQHWHMPLNQEVLDLLRPKAQIQKYGLERSNSFQYLFI